jgi:hypothetical protein
VLDDFCGFYIGSGKFGGVVVKIQLVTPVSVRVRLSGRGRAEEKIVTEKRQRKGRETRRQGRAETREARGRRKTKGR